MLQFISDQCTYLGVSPTHKGHKCLNLEGRIFISNDVISNETMFPCKTSYIKADDTSKFQPSLSSKTSKLMLFLPKSNFIPHLDRALPSHVPPTIQSFHNTVDTTTLPIDHNALHDAHNQ